MSERMLLATRKGLITLTRKSGAWSVARTDFPGVAVTAALHDARDGTLYAALKHGHFGCKMHRSDDDGRSWQELPAPAFPLDAAGSPTLFQVWTLEAGLSSQPGRLWAGALPAGLFRSNDRGASWQLVDALWNVPERAAFTPSHPIRATPTKFSWRFPAAACGTHPMTAKAGTCAATGWSRPICRRSRPACARCRTRTAWRVAP
jgi:hypothetical protein